MLLDNISQNNSNVYHGTDIAAFNEEIELSMMEDEYNKST